MVSWAFYHYSNGTRILLLVPLGTSEFSHFTYWQSYCLSLAFLHDATVSPLCFSQSETIPLKLFRIVLLLRSVTLQSVPLTSSFGSLSVPRSDTHVLFLSSKLFSFILPWLSAPGSFLLFFFFHQQCQHQSSAHELFPHSSPKSALCTEGKIDRTCEITV